MKPIDFNFTKLKPGTLIKDVKPIKLMTSLAEMKPYLANGKAVATMEEVIEANRALYQPKFPSSIEILKNQSKLPSGIIKDPALHNSNRIDELGLKPKFNKIG